MGQGRGRCKKGVIFDFFDRVGAGVKKGEIPQFLQGRHAKNLDKLDRVAGCSINGVNFHKIHRGGLWQKNVTNVTGGVVVGLPVP